MLLKMDSDGDHKITEFEFLRYCLSEIEMVDRDTLNAVRECRGAESENIHTPGIKHTCTFACCPHCFLN